MTSEQKLERAYKLHSAIKSANEKIERLKKIGSARIMMGISHEAGSDWMERQNGLPVDEEMRMAVFNHTLLKIEIYKQNCERELEGLLK